MMDGVAAQVMALTQQLEQSQWSSAEQLRAQQLEQLHLVLKHAWETIPYYRKRLEQSRFKPKRKLTPEIFRKIPILSRRDVQLAEKQLASNSLPKSHGGVSVISTSGSTGRPIKTLSSELTQIFFQALSLRENIWHQRDMTALFGSIKHTPGVESSHKAKGLSPVFDNIFQTQAAVGLNVHTPLPKQLKWILEHKPRYLLTYPSNLNALLHKIESQGHPVSGIQHIQTIGETVTPELRSLTKNTLGVDLIDIYSAQEAGAIAIQCPDHPHYHIQSESLYVEILDQKGKPCKPGQTGRVVLSTLHNFATPLIRYEIGDLAEVGKPCSCGRGLPVLKKILGRTRNMLVLPNGDTMWPRLGSQNFRDLTGADIQQIQIIQKSVNRLDIQVVVEKPLSAAQQLLIIDLMHQNYHHAYDIRFHYSKEIMRSKSGKFEEFISEVSD